jgi:hypothetical protein
LVAKGVLRASFSLTSRARSHRFFPP